MHRTATLLALPVLALTAALLAGCAPGSPGAHSPETAGPSHSATPSAEPTDEAAIDGDATDGGPAFDIRANIVDSVSSGNTAALRDLFAPTVYVSYCASETFGNVSDHDLLVSDVTEASSPTAVWDFNLSAATIDGYRNGSGGAYVADFPSGAVVGLSSESKVISFVITGDVITILFICNAADALS